MTWTQIVEPLALDTHDHGGGSGSLGPGVNPSITGSIANALIFTGGEASGSRNFIVGQNNLLQAWAGYPEFSVTSAVTGTAVAPSAAAQRLLFNADNTATALTFNAGAVPTGSTATLTYLQGTAPAISQLGHGYGTLFARLRLPVPGVKIQLEFTIDNGSTWTVGHASAIAHATVGGNTLFIGNEIALNGNPNGFRITIDFNGCSASSALHLIEAGIHHEAFPLGMYSFAKTYAVNTFRGKQTFKDGLQLVPGAGNGKVLTSDAAGNASWTTLPSSANGEHIIIWNGTGWVYDGQVVTSRPAGIAAYPNAYVKFKTDMYPSFTTPPTTVANGGLAMPGDVWRRNGSIEVIV